MNRMGKTRQLLRFAVIVGCGLLVAVYWPASAGDVGENAADDSHYLPLVYTRLCNPGSLIPPDDLERDLAVEARINEIRDQNNLHPFTHTEEVAQAALRHSNDMADNNFFSHIGSDDSKVGVRLTEACYSWRSYGEIIAAGYTSPASVVTAWMGSPGHRGIILDADLADFGAGYAYNAKSKWKHYWTVDFGLRTAELYFASGPLHECNYHVQEEDGELWISLYTSQACELIGLNPREDFLKD